MTGFLSFGDLVLYEVGVLTSCSRFFASQLWALLTASAYVLMQELRPRAGTPVVLISRVTTKLESPRATIACVMPKRIQDLKPLFINQFHYRQPLEYPTVELMKHSIYQQHSLFMNGQARRDAIRAVEERSRVERGGRERRFERPVSRARASHNRLPRLGLEL